MLESRSAYGYYGATAIIPRQKGLIIMTLKAFNDVNVTTETRYKVFDGKKFIYSFVVDLAHYLDKAESTYKLTELINKGAKVQFVDVDSVTKLMEVTVQLPAQKKSKR